LALHDRNHYERPGEPPVLRAAAAPVHGR